MAEFYKFDKIFDIGTTYRAEPDKAYIIKAVGTDSTTIARCLVAGAPCCEFLDEFAPCYKINTNLYGPIELGDSYIVVPPDKTLEFSGESGKDVRALGELVVLGPGEALATIHMARFETQTKRFLSYQRDTYSHGTDTAWAADYEKDILTFSVPAGERWEFADILGATVENVSGGLKKGQFAVRIYVDDKAYDNVVVNMGRKGIYVLSCHLPPKEDVTFTPFSLLEYPIRLGPGRTLRISCINVSGASISPSAGTSLTVTVLIVGICEYIT